MFKRVNKITAKKNLTSLIIDVFNACSLWLTLTLFDLVYLLLVVIERIVRFFVNKRKIRIIVINGDLYDQLRAERPTSILAAGTSVSCTADGVQFSGIVI